MLCSLLAGGSSLIMAVAVVLVVVVAVAAALVLIMPMFMGLVVAAAAVLMLLRQLPVLLHCLRGLPPSSLLLTLACGRCCEPRSVCGS
jgi:hypothetical protein